MADRDEIPEGVRNLLRHPWRSADGVSAFETVADVNSDRWRDPSFYIPRKGSAPPNSLDFDDVSGLVNSADFEGLIADRGDHAVINEHAEHALADFCSAVYDEWEKCQVRLRSIPRTRALD